MHELADPVDDLHLVRLQPPDEVPAERIAVLGVLLLEVLSAVLPDDRHTRLDERRHVGERNVLRRGDDRHGRADLRPAPGRSAPGSRQARAPITPCTPRARPSRRCEKKSSGLSRVHRSTRSTRATPAARSARSAARQRSSFRPRVRSSSNSDRHLPPDLVAARPDRRPDHRRLRAVAERGHACRDDAFGSPRQPACSTASARGPSVTATAIGRQSADIASIGSCGSSVQRPSPGSPATGKRTVHRRRVHLAVEREPVGGQSHSLAGQPPVLLDTLRGCRPFRGQVQRAYGASLTPPARVVNATR